MTCRCHAGIEMRKTVAALGRDGQPGIVRVAEDRVEFVVTTDGQDWRVAWHPAPSPPPGTAHGSAGICVTGDQVVLVSSDGLLWGLPGGRPEPGEDWADTLRREVREEACVTVTGCRLLGYSRGACVRGHEAGLVLVRAHWLAQVRVDGWQPRFEMVRRRLVPTAEGYASIWIPDGYRPLYRRMFTEAGLPAD